MRVQQEHEFRMHQQQQQQEQQQQQQQQQQQHQQHDQQQQQQRYNHQLQQFQQHARQYGSNLGGMTPGGSMGGPPGSMGATGGMGNPNMGGPGNMVPGSMMQPGTHGMPGMQQQQQKKGLSLTREQMLAAQEMFRSANRVTRAEKALILGFMAGARDNPFPQQGPVITIKLSEDSQEITNAEGPQSMVIEMLFEMNYDTGHWRRLKRTKVVSQQQQA